MSNKPQRGKSTRPSRTVAPSIVPRSTPMPSRPFSSGPRTSAITIIDESDRKTWAYKNSKASDQDRVIAIRNPEGRYCHPSCADSKGILKPTSRPMPPTIHARMASKVASSGGMLCILCNTFIVPPTTTRGKERAKTMWEKANTAYLKGEITESEWLVAAKRFASSKNED